MKTILITISVLSSSVVAYAQVAFHFQALYSSSQVCSAVDYTNYSRAAMLPKGFDFTKFAEDRLNYPELARTYGIEGSVIVQVHVAPSGKTQFVKIVNSVGYGCDKEAQKMIEELPDFIPAVFEGRKISSSVNLEIKFKM